MREDDALSRLFSAEKQGLGEKAKTVIGRASAGVSASLFNCVILNKLFLGSFPTTIADVTKCVDTLKELALVVGAVEEAECKGRPGVKIWKENNVEYYQLPIPDNTAEVQYENLYPVLLKMHAVMQAGGKVLVHCNGGKSRSAMVVASYLHLFEHGPHKLFREKASVDDICDQLIVCRSIVDLRQEHKLIIGGIKDFHREMIERQRSGDDPLKPYVRRDNKQDKKIIYKNLDRFFASEYTKRKIANLPSIKALNQYVLRKGDDKRKEYLNELISDIVRAQDATWYITLSENRGPMRMFCGKDAVKVNWRESKDRPILIRNLKAELNGLVLKYLGYEALSNEVPENTRVRFILDENYVVPREEPVEQPEYGSIMDETLDIELPEDTEQESPRAPGRDGMFHHGAAVPQQNLHNARSNQRYMQPPK